MKAPRLVLRVVLAAIFPIAACNQPAADNQKGVCGSAGDSCTATSDCCSGFSCQSSLCVFNGGGNGSGTSGGGGSTASSSSTGTTTRGGGTSGSSSSSSTSSAGFVTAPHGMTQVTNQAGAVLTNPVLVTMTFQDDSYRTNMETFDKFLTSSQWYAQVSPQFSLGTASEIDVELTQNAPASIDDTTIETNIAALIQAGTAPGLNGGTVSLSNAVYMMYYPAKTAITVQGTPMCQFSAGGYHSEYTVANQSFSYAVVTDCAGQLPVNEPYNIEWSASHEFMEAATDPFPQSFPAWQISDQTNPWAAVGGEVGDLCTGIYPQWSEGSHPAIQRIWSNASAAAGGDPCLPEPPNDPYYSTDLEPLTFVPVAAGSSTTFTVTGWSTAAVPTWQVFASPYEGSFNAGSSLSVQSLNNGDTGTLTLTVPVGTASQNYSTVTVVSGNSQTDFTSTIVGVYVP